MDGEIDERMKGRDEGFYRLFSTSLNSVLD